MLVAISDVRAGNYKKYTSANGPQFDAQFVVWTPFVLEGRTFSKGVIRITKISCEPCADIKVHVNGKDLGIVHATCTQIKAQETKGYFGLDADGRYAFKGFDLVSGERYLIGESK